MTDLVDVTLPCADCGTSFYLTAAEQAWLIERFGPAYKLPRRCRPCRVAKRTQYEQREAASQA